MEVVVAITGLAGLVGAVGICMRAAPLGSYLGLIDKPDNVRKLHERPTPLVGGVALIPAVFGGLFASAFLHSNADGALLALAGAAAFLGGLGYLDDRLSLGAKRRLVMSLLVFVLLVASHPVYRTEFVWLGMTNIQAGASAVSVLAVIACTGMLNAFNMADGVNGLSLGLASVWLGLLATVCDGPTSDAALAMLPAVLAVLAFNLNGLLFIGDTGTYMLGGTIIGLMLLAAGTGEITHAQIVAFMILPVLDAVWLIVARTRGGSSALAADRNHLHHLLIDRIGPLRCVAAYLGIVLGGSLLALAGPVFALASIAMQIAIFLAIRLSTKRPAETCDPRASRLRG